MIPDSLTDSQRAQVRVWCLENFPDLATELVRLEDACLDHHRGLPKHDKRRQRCDWPATLRNWIRKHAQFTGLPQGAQVATRRAPQITELQDAPKETRERMAEQIGRIRDRVHAKRRPEPEVEPQEPDDICEFI